MPAERKFSEMRGKTAREEVTSWRNHPTHRDSGGQTHAHAHKPKTESHSNATRGAGLARARCVRVPSKRGLFTCVRAFGSRVALFGALAAAHLHELSVEAVEDVPVHRVHRVGQLSRGGVKGQRFRTLEADAGGKAAWAYLVRVAVEVKILQEAGGELAEERVVRLVDGPQAPVGVVVGARARAEWTHWTGAERERGQYHANPYFLLFFKG